MAVSPLDSALYGALFSDDEIRALIDDRAGIRAMLRVEAALARVQGRLEVIPADAADAIGRTADHLSVEPISLASDTAQDGVPVPGLVKALKRAVGAPHADFVHFGPTSQDIIDTALVLTSGAALDVIDARLDALVRSLADLAERHMSTIMAGRTRFQLASPTTFGLKAAGWALPLHRHRARLAELRPRLATVSLAGASGNLASLGRAGPAVEAGLAEELGLGVAAGPWHAARDVVAELGGWLSLVSGSLGKIGADILLLAQNEVSEARPKAGGGSSTMPHKANPVGAEVLVALARINADRLSSLHHALLHSHERDGAAWATEWLTLPEMLVAAGASTRTGLGLLDGLIIDAGAMRARATGAPGLLMSEIAAFALAAVMPRSEALRQVNLAAKAAVAEERSLIEVLEERLGPVLDWAALARLDMVLEASATRTSDILRCLRATI